MKIASKLLISYLGIAAIVGITGITAYAVTSLIAASYAKVSDSLDQTIQPAADVQVAVRKAASSLQLYLLLGNQNDKNTFLDRMEFTKQRTADLGSSLHTDEQRNDFAVVQYSIRNIENVSTSLIEHYDKGPSSFSATNHTALLNLLEQQTGNARVAAGNIANLEVQRIKQDAAQTDDIIQSAEIGFVAFAAAAVAVAIVIAVTSSRSITKPLKELTKSAEEIAKGNFDLKLGIKQKDELGVFALGFERMQVELKEKDRVKDEFVKVASHEIGTPIVPILLNAEALEHEIGDGNPRLQAIVRNARRANMLTSILLDVSRIDSGTFKLLRQKTDVVELAEEAIEAYRFRLQENTGLKINVVTTLSRQEATIDVDRTRIYQVLYNLLDNAIKFTEKGQISIEVLKDGDSQNNILVRVSDTGSGISPAISSKLFERYATDSPDKKGTGLGLYLSRTIIEEHGGKIWGENNSNGRGATFYFTLPANGK